ncbi:hypothetical protein GSI_10604 [Ganoderma sinense ZZ0214-1]|uniref:Uncharacterized protein n=1 Tax=Ganoderma sinense ZZ0214-1 TaxID=1077348 RepID=A0A2G8S125_9APHY|nr:hypothetical protein GSI_10604 [Ganoderma sinense ZZ0214-1]
MAQVALTNDICRRIENPTDHCVLVVRPIVQATTIEELEDREIGGFHAQYRVTLTDGNGDMCQVVFPRGADIGTPGEATAVTEGTVIKIDQMVRIPHGDNRSVVVVHSAEVATGNPALALTDMDQAIRQLTEGLRSETTRREEAEERLQVLLQGVPTPQNLIYDILAILADVFAIVPQIA